MLVTASPGRRGPEGCQRAWLSGHLDSSASLLTALNIHLLCDLHSCWVALAPDEATCHIRMPGHPCRSACGLRSSPWHLVDDGEERHREALGAGMEQSCLQRGQTQGMPRRPPWCGPQKAPNLRGGAAGRCCVGLAGKGQGPSSPWWHRCMAICFPHNQWVVCRPGWVLLLREHVCPAG